MNYLASPPLVVAYALAGTMNIDLTTEPIGTSSDGRSIFLRDIWPDDDEIVQTVRSSLSVESFASRYGSVYEGDERWQSIEVPDSSTFDWDKSSTYVLEPPFFGSIGADLPAPRPVERGSILAIFGDSVTTDHISPAGSIRPESPAGKWLEDHGVEPSDFNSYGSRRGNHEVMMRGTFANIRIRNLMLPGVEGGFTVHVPTHQNTTIYDAAMMYASDGATPLIVVAGKEYGTGSSRDWAAKGPALLGIRAAVAMSFERIHRSNLVGMGILPLQLPDGISPQDIGITGTEEVSIPNMEALWHDPIPRTLEVRFGKADMVANCTVRLDTDTEVKYFRNGGILQYVLRQML
jgi:aconitate hydratase